MSIVLVIVDMQNAFFEGDPLKPLRKELTDNCNDLIAAAREKGFPVINIRTQHERNKSTWTRNMLDDDQGFIFAGDDDTQNVEGLDIDGAVQIVKTRDNAFYGTDLEARLKNFQAEKIVLCGVSTHTCVAMTAADAYARNRKVFLARDAIGTHMPEVHESTLGILHAEYRQPVLSNAEILRDAFGA